MNTLGAFSMGKERELMVFDWDKAARIIKETGAKYASAALRGYWEYTGGAIFVDGKIFLYDYTFLASKWAVPELEADGKIYECYRMQHEVPEWDCKTKWPKSARKIISE